MSLASIFNKIKLILSRLFQKSLPQVSEAKRYGSDGEEKFADRILVELPGCKIKKNVIISTPDGNAEIDCLILYQNKLFAIEIKSWKGSLIEKEEGILQVKRDRWTGETHTKLMKSPFKQLNRAIFLLRKQHPTKAWVNGIVYFEPDELESVSVHPENIWFSDVRSLANYIRNEGKASYDTTANAFFNKCTPADYIYARAWGKSLHCIIDNDSLSFDTDKGHVSAKDIFYINISHHLSYDDLTIQLTNGSSCVTRLENGNIKVNDNDKIVNYAFSKLDYIEPGRALT